MRPTSIEVRLSRAISVQRGIDLASPSAYRNSSYRMRQRALRVRPLPRFPAALSNRPYDVLNISLTGALGLLEEPPLRHGVYPLRIGDGGDALDLLAHVVRTNPVGAYWETAVDFANRSPPTQHRIGIVLTKLIRDFRQP